MTVLELCLTAAALPQVLIALANFFAPRVLRYRENLAHASPMVRQIFRVHCVYIVLVVAAAAAACLAFPHELAGASALGRSLSAFLAVFWGLRLLIQLVYYDPAERSAHPVLNLLFLAAFGYLTAVFSAAALLGVGA